MSKDILTGPNLRLRAVEPADIDMLYEWENNTSVWNVSNTLTPFSRFQIEEYVMNSQNDIYAARQLRLMIELYTGVAAPETIGCIDLFDFEPHHLRAGIGVLIAEKYRDQGYAGEALEILMYFAFGTLHLHQLYCNIAANNLNSVHLFEKHGFTRCGIKREWLIEGLSWSDEWMFQRIQTNE